ncbi:MAG: NifB/NifX family molybdenum-iron cluster-binding protein [Promethearchaeota archaeon]
MSRIIGIPANGPDLSDLVSQHFGHCEYFVGVKIENGSFTKAFAVQNLGHSACLEPVFKMKEQKVTDMILGGIGGRPFMGFIQMGINLYQAVSGTIKENIKLLLDGKLEALGGPSCSGGGQH